MMSADGGVAIHASNPSLGLLVLLGKHKLEDLDWRGHRAVTLCRDHHEVNFTNKIVKQPERWKKIWVKKKKQKQHNTRITNKLTEEK
jgi:hypothetical protein